MFLLRCNSKFVKVLSVIVVLGTAALACTLPGSLGPEKPESAAVPVGQPTPQPTPRPLDEAPPRSAKAGDTWTSAKDGTVLVYVPAGEFLMGAREYDLAAEPDEMPMHKVTLDGFWIDQTEVTHAQYAAFLTEMGNQKSGNVPWFEVDSPDAWISVVGPKWVVDEGWEDHPVHEVTWHGAQAYCQWVGRTLPTEAQWEKAARGVDGLIYPWGDSNPNCSVVNFSNDQKFCTESKVSAPVGSFPAGASPFNVLDMAGNIWEWVADWYSDSYYANSPAENPTGPENGSNKVMRGGAWESGPRNLRASDRTNDGPAVARYRLGFRCAINP